MRPGTYHMWDPAMPCVQIGATTSPFYTFLLRHRTLENRYTWGFAPRGEGGLNFLQYVNSAIVRLK